MQVCICVGWEHAPAEGTPDIWNPLSPSSIFPRRPFFACKWKAVPGVCVCVCSRARVWRPTLPFWFSGSMVSVSAPMSTIMPSWNPSVGWGAHTGLPSSMAYPYQHDHTTGTGRGRKGKRGKHDYRTAHVWLNNSKCKLQFTVLHVYWRISNKLLLSWSHCLACCPTLV